MAHTIGITMGDPKGIGPEITVKALSRLDDSFRSRMIIYGNSDVIDRAYSLINKDIPRIDIVATSDIDGDPSLISDADAADAAISAIDRASKDARDGKIGAIVTAPVNKKRLQAVRKNFLGHTEYLAADAGIDDPTMMFIIGDKMSRPFGISIVTTHMPLKEVLRTLSVDLILRTIKRTAEAIQRYSGRSHPRLAVTSLNPHAGEGGLFGDEEKRIIRPAIEEAVSAGIDCQGPLPSDSLLGDLHGFDYDGVVAMYHDQGLIPAKILGRGRCTNVTLGLPYVRTSPGHGTAEDISWKGVADEDGMKSAIIVADEMLAQTNYRKETRR